MLDSDYILKVNKMLATSEENQILNQYCFKIFWDVDGEPLALSKTSDWDQASYERMCLACRDKKNLQIEPEVLEHFFSKRSDTLSSSFSVLRWPQWDVVFSYYWVVEEEKRFITFHESTTGNRNEIISFFFGGKNQNYERLYI